MQVHRSSAIFKLVSYEKCFAERKGKNLKRYAFSELVYFTRNVKSLNFYKYSNCGDAREKLCRDGGDFARTRGVCLLVSRDNRRRERENHRRR